MVADIIQKLITELTRLNVRLKIFKIYLKPKNKSKIENN